MKTNIFKSFSSVLLIVSIALNLGLIYETSLLKKQFAQKTSLTVGSRVPSFTALDLSDRPASLSLITHTTPTVLYVFSPSCGWCEKNLSNLRTLISQSDSKYNIVGLAVSDIGLDTYLKSKQINMKIYKRVSSRDMSNMHLGTTPQMLVFDPNGVLQLNVEGAFTQEDCQEIERKLELKQGLLIPVL